MKVAPMGKVRNNFSQYMTMCEQEPVFVTRNGRITAVLEHIEDENIEDYLLERSPRFHAMLDRVRRQQGAVPLGELRERLKI